jgi:hypothetical protein
MGFHDILMNRSVSTEDDRGLTSYTNNHDPARDQQSLQQSTTTLRANSNCSSKQARPRATSNRSNKELTEAMVRDTMKDGGGAAPPGEGQPPAQDTQDNVETQETLGSNTQLNDLGDFENDADLTEEEKASFRQQRAAAVAAHNKGKHVKFEEPAADPDTDSKCKENRLNSQRESLAAVTAKTVETQIYLGYDKATDNLFLQLYNCHANSEEEILSNMRNTKDFQECVDDHPGTMFGHSVNMMRVYEDHLLEITQLQNEATAKEQEVDDLISCAKEQVAAIKDNDILALTQKCNRMTKVKNDYTAKVAVYDDKIAASRASNIKLASQLGDLTNKHNQLLQRNHLAMNGNSFEPAYQQQQHQQFVHPYNARPPTTNSSSPPLTLNPFIAVGNPLALPPSLRDQQQQQLLQLQHQEQPQVARSAVSENLTATNSKMKDIEVFKVDEKDKADYKYWRHSARNFLQKTNIYTTVQDQIDYIIDHLRGPAAQRTEYRAQAGRNNSYITIEDIFTDLNRMYDTIDPTSEATAALWDNGVNGLKQTDKEEFDQWVGRVR